jgi:hypothetical protein
MNEPFVHESIIGTQFIGKVVGKQLSLLLAKAFQLLLLRSQALHT